MNYSIDAIRQIAEEIRAALGDDFDDQAFLDTLDGETDAMDMIGNLILSREEAKAQCAAMKEVALTYTARAARMDAKADACVLGLGRLLDAIGETKVAHPLGTVSRTKPRQSLLITAQDEIPSQLCKSVPDNAAIKAALEAGEVIPGAELKLGQPGLTVRIK